MTNPNKTSITVVLDKSGSMSNVRNDTVGGFNFFVESQKSVPGDCEISLIQFSNTSEFTYKSKSLQELKQGLLLEEYRPNGGTALLDAIGKAINEKGVELSNLKEEDRPSKVMFVIITDGEENASKEFSVEKIKEMIEQQKNVYSWDFTFLGANIDTFAAASSMGIDMNKSLSFSTTKDGGAKRAFASVNMYARSARSLCKGSSMADVSYTTKDRVDNA